MRLCIVVILLGLAACSSAVNHLDTLTLDTHIDIPITLGEADADPRLDGPMQVDLPKIQRGGLDAGFFIVYVKQAALSEQGYKQAYGNAQAKFSAIERMLNNSADTVVLVRSPAQLRQAVAEGKLAVAIGVENAYPLGPKFEHLQEFYQRGARYISLTHFGHNHFGDSSVAKGSQGDEPKPNNNGISELGKRLIREMNTLGIMVDVSHTSSAATVQAAQYSKAPVIASHSGVKAVYDHPRNLSDEEIKAIAASGGVVQLVAFDSYMRTVSKQEKAAQKAIREQLGLAADDWYKHASQTQIQQVRIRTQALHSRWPRATIETLVEHIDYVVNLVGIDHAGIASDFGGGGGVQGWDSIDKTPAVTAALARRGYSSSDIKKIWAGNLLRVWQAVEDYAQDN